MADTDWKAALEKALRSKSKKTWAKAAEELAAVGPDAVGHLVATALEAPSSNRARHARSVLAAMPVLDEPASREALADYVAAVFVTEGIIQKSEDAYAVVDGQGLAARCLEPIVSWLYGCEQPREIKRWANAMMEWLPDEEARRFVDRMQDHPLSPFRAWAHQRAEAIGVPVRPYPWEGAPLAPTVAQELTRLGATRRPEVEEAGLGHWEGQRRWTDVDPEGQAKELPPALAYWVANVRLPSGLEWSAPDWPARKIHIVPGDHGWDVDMDGRRRLLYPIAHDDHQFFYCMDVLAPVDNPPIYKIDHDGTSPYLAHFKLSQFLAHVR